MEKLNRYIDHTLLSADAKTEDIKRLCAEAVEHEFYSVCVNPCRVSMAKDEIDMLWAKKSGSGSVLQTNKPKVAAVCGFPLGSSATEVKVLEARTACQSGASEIDMVINIGYIKDGNVEECYKDIYSVVREAESLGGKVKVIIETCYLSHEEKILACEIAMGAGAEFVKTSTGFGSGRATEEDVKLMKNTVKGRCLVKASGGIRTSSKAIAMIEAGADRIGTSASIAIVSES